jgi:hypothetical protein
VLVPNGAPPQDELAVDIAHPVVALHSAQKIVDFLSVERFVDKQSQCDPVQVKLVIGALDNPVGIGGKTVESARFLVAQINVRKLLVFQS